MSDAPVDLPFAVTDAYCRRAYGNCPGYRWVRAAGHLVHPADFRAWVLDDAPPGRAEAPREPPDGPDGA